MFKGFAIAFSLACILLFSNCASKDHIHELIISTSDQRLALYRQGVPIRVYPVSTSKFGLGSQRGSNRTPLGRMEIAKKIGHGAPVGAVFKSRRRTGEILVPNAPGRDPIVTRILWLKGLESHNRSTYHRYIYIHGTPQEIAVGTPASYGCIRMRSRDIVDLFGIVGNGAAVTVQRSPISQDARDWWNRSQGIESGSGSETTIPARRHPYLQDDSYPRSVPGIMIPTF